MSDNSISDPLAIALVSQRLFNHNILLALINSGALSQRDGGSVAAATSDQIRSLAVSGAGERLADKMAEAFESMASDLLGLSPLPRDPTD
jgi:hypothetical protein